MRGEILHYDEGQGFGFISGADGNRYTFRREDLRRETLLGKGTPVEFEANGGQAKNVFAVRAQAGSVPSVGASSSAQTYSQVSAQRQYGRNASADYGAQAGTSLWNYFKLALTTNYVNFSGRARRKEYWGYTLFSILGFFAAAIVGIAVDSALGNMTSDNPVAFATLILVTLWWLGTLLPSIAVAVRRFHDVGLSGWLLLLFLVLSVITIGSIIIFIISVLPSQMHENKWGPIPPGIRPPPPTHLAPE